MKRPAVDYRNFRFSRLNDPAFSHLKLLSAWIGYLVMYLLTENLIPAERCHLIHAPLDDLIPFCEAFVVFYVLWYLFVFLALLWYLLYDAERFRQLQTFIIITQIVAMAVYILYPSVQDLRPETFPRENVFTWVLTGIYAADTPTGVCPSLHVAYSLGISSVYLKDPKMSRWAKWAVVVLSLLICASTLFVKQHSVLDVGSGLLLSLLAELIVFGKSWWLPRLRRRKSGS